MPRVSALPAVQGIIALLTLCAKVPLVTKLVITERKNYPLGRSFPANLKELHIRGLVLSKFDSRITKLMHLKILCIQDNSFKTVPNSIEHMCLEALNIAKNSLTSWPSIAKNSNITHTLKVLDLSNNSLTWLPDDFWNLCHLQHLDLSSKFFYAK